MVFTEAHQEKRFRQRKQRQDDGDRIVAANTKAVHHLHGVGYQSVQGVISQGCPLWRANGRGGFITGCDKPFDVRIGHDVPLFLFCILLIVMPSQSLEISPNP